jgi:hypothetical protein
VCYKMRREGVIVLMHRVVEQTAQCASRHIREQKIDLKNADLLKQVSIRMDACQSIHPSSCKMQPDTRRPCEAFNTNVPVARVQLVPRESYEAVVSGESLLAKLAKDCERFVEAGDIPLPGLDDSSAREILHSMSDHQNGPHLFLTVESLQRNVQGTRRSDDDSAKTLRQIQLQVVFRLQLWRRYGDIFVDAFTKNELNTKRAGRTGQVKRKKKLSRLSAAVNETPLTIILKDVTTILSVAAFHLPPELCFSAFVHDCLTTAVSTGITRAAIQSIYDFFEIENPDSRIKLSMFLSPPRKQKRKRSSVESSAVLSQEDAPFTAIVEELHGSTNISVSAAATTSYFQPKNSQEVELLLPKRVQLIAPTVNRTNSLLSSSARSRFVGSHFNTNLSNMGSLFRQVKSSASTTQPVPKCAWHERSKKSSTSPASIIRKETVRKVIPSSSSSSSSPLAKRFMAQQHVVLETPCKKPSMRQKNSVLAETPCNQQKILFGTCLVAEARRAIEARNERRQR